MSDEPYDDGGAAPIEFRPSADAQVVPDVPRRWAAEVPLRWVGRSERRVVVSIGTNDVLQGITLARHRLNLANLLDDAATSGVGTFVVSPPPTDDPELNARLEVLVEAQA